MADVYGRYRGHRDQRSRRQEDCLLDIRPRHRGALHDPVDVERPASAGAYDVRRDQLDLRTDGNDFPLQRQFTQAFDRNTGLRPNPALGAPGGYYVDSSQTMLYNGLQTSVRKRFSNRYSWDVNYSFGKSESTQGGDLSAYYIAAFENNQHFLGKFPEFDRGPSSNDLRHRLNVSAIYELPGFGEGTTNAILAAGRFLPSCRRDRARHCASRSHPASIAAELTSSTAPTSSLLIGRTPAPRPGAIIWIETASRWCRPAPSRVRRFGPAPT